MSRRLLIVEDEGAVVMDLEATLTRFGYEIAEACATGEDAVARAAELKPNLVLMDIRLAGALDGIEAAARIQAENHVPVVYLTAQGDKATLARAGLTHAYGYILKPFDERELELCIDAALYRHEAEAELKRHREALEALVRERTRELAEKSRELELATRVKSDFLRAVTHELRTPLHHVIGFGELLADPTSGASQEKRRSYAESILESGRRLASLVDDLLALASLEPERLHLSPAPVALGELLRATLSLFAGAEAKGIDLRAEISPGAEGIAYVDAPKLALALSQLLSNAVKFTPRGGRVTLRAHPGLVEGTLDIAVVDTGVGIPEDRLATLFAPFSKPDIGVGAAPGLGVGLPLAHRLLELHGADLSVKSRVGEGSEFGFTLVNFSHP